MALSAIALCSRALLKIGAKTIASFSEGSAEAEVAANLYPSTRDALLSGHPWGFASGQTALGLLEASPLADFDNAFQLPNDFLRALSAGVPGRGRGTPYRIAEDRLHASTDEIVLSYVFRPEESAFPPFFDQTLIARLAAEFCIPLTESTTRTELLFRQADDEFRRAKLVDAQQETPARVEDFSLVQVRA